jgi:hypothetical protein
LTLRLFIAEFTIIKPNVKKLIIIIVNFITCTLKQLRIIYRAA